MRLIVINRKRLGVTLVIIGLMLILFAFENKFDGRLKYMALMNSNMNVLKEYTGLDHRLSYKLPEQWKTERKDFPGGEIIYHNEFTSEDMKIHGFVQVWSRREDLKSFLEESKKVSEKENKVKNYKINPIKVNKKDGFQVSYMMETPSKINYMAEEYFIKEKDGFVRFSFFVAENNFKETMPTIFKTLVETYKYKE